MSSGSNPFMVQPGVVDVASLQSEDILEVRMG